MSFKCFSVNVRWHLGQPKSLRHASNRRYQLPGICSFVAMQFLLSIRWGLELFLQSSQAEWRAGRLWVAMLAFVIWVRTFNLKSHSIVLCMILMAYFIMPISCHFYFWATFSICSARPLGIGRRQRKHLALGKCRGGGRGSKSYGHCASPPLTFSGRRRWILNDFNELRCQWSCCSGSGCGCIMPVHWLKVFTVSHPIPLVSFHQHA